MEWQQEKCEQVLSCQIYLKALLCVIAMFYFWNATIVLHTVMYFTVAQFVDFFFQIENEKNKQECRVD